jgi:hypothetical protein
MQKAEPPVMRIDRGVMPKTQCHDQTSSLPLSLEVQGLDKNADVAGHHSAWSLQK